MVDIARFGDGFNHINACNWQARYLVGLQRSSLAKHFLAKHVDNNDSLHHLIFGNVKAEGLVTFHWIREQYHRPFLSLILQSVETDNVWGAKTSHNAVSHKGDVVLAHHAALAFILVDEAEFNLVAVLTRHAQHGIIAVGRAEMLQEGTSAALAVDKGTQLHILIPLLNAVNGHYSYDADVVGKGMDVGLPQTLIRLLRQDFASINIVVSQNLTIFGIRIVEIAFTWGHHKVVGEPAEAFIIGGELKVALDEVVW